MPTQNYRKKPKNIQVKIKVTGIPKEHEIICLARKQDGFFNDVFYLVYGRKDSHETYELASGRLDNLIPSEVNETIKSDDDTIGTIVMKFTQPTFNSYCRKKFTFVPNSKINPVLEGPEGITDLERLI